MPRHVLHGHIEGKGFVAKQIFYPFFKMVAKLFPSLLLYGSIRWEEETCGRLISGLAAIPHVGQDYRTRETHRKRLFG